LVFIFVTFPTPACSYSLSFPRGLHYIDATTTIYLQEHVAAIEEFCKECKYTGDVFTVFATARELRATMLDRLSPEAVAAIPHVFSRFGLLLIVHYHHNDLSRSLIWLMLSLHTFSIG
jgi:hypothetical protein